MPAGYAGGDKNGASYRAVSSGNTRHAEAVQITFDPAEISYGELLQIFFSVVHDLMQLNRQGSDSGTQYRSAIFYADELQKKIAQAYIAQLDKGASLPGGDRHPRRCAQGLLRGGGLSPGLPDEQPPSSLHRFQQPAEVGKF